MELAAARQAQSARRRAASSSASPINTSSVTRSASPHGSRRSSDVRMPARSTKPRRGSPARWTKPFARTRRSPSESITASTRSPTSGAVSQNVIAISWLRHAHRGQGPQPARASRRRCGRRRALCARRRPGRSGAAADVAGRARGANVRNPQNPPPHSVHRWLLASCRRGRRRRRSARPRASRPLRAPTADLGGAADRTCRWSRRIQVPTTRSVRPHVVGHRRSHLVPAPRDPDSTAPQPHDPFPRRVVLCPRVACPHRPSAPDRGQTRDHADPTIHDDACTKPRLACLVTQGVRRTSHPMPPRASR